MGQIQLNHPKRSEVKELTNEELNEAVAYLSFLIKNQTDANVFQRLISDYENLRHYKSYTSGIEKKLEDLENKLANANYDCTQVNEMRMKEVKKNSELLNALKEMLFMTDVNFKNIGKCKTLSEAEALAKQAIENNK